MKKIALERVDRILEVYSRLESFKFSQAVRVATGLLEVGNPSLDIEIIDIARLCQTLGDSGWLSGDMHHIIQFAVNDVARRIEKKSGVKCPFLEEHD